MSEFSPLAELTQAETSTPPDSTPPDAGTLRKAVNFLRAALLEKYVVDCEAFRNYLLGIDADVVAVVDECRRRGWIKGPLDWLRRTNTDGYSTTGVYRLCDALQTAPAELQAETSPPGTGQAEGEGERIPSAKPPAPGDETNRYAALAKLKPIYRKAYYAFAYAEAKNECRLQDLDAWDWLKENGTDGAGSGELDGYELPVFATWARYLRKARNATGERKYTPRTAKAPPASAVRGDELDRQEPDNE